MQDREEKDFKFNPHLPTLSEAKQHHNYHSDHLPVSTMVPIGNLYLNAVSWNLLVPNLYSGYDNIEEPINTLARIKKITEAMELINENQFPDIIALQENFLFGTKPPRPLSKENYDENAVKDRITTLKEQKHLAEMNVLEQQVKLAELKPDTKEFNELNKLIQEKTQAYRDYDIKISNAANFIAEMRAKDEEALRIANEIHEAKLKFKEKILEMGFKIVDDGGNALLVGKRVTLEESKSENPFTRPEEAFHYFKTAQRQLVKFNNHTIQITNVHLPHEGTPEKAERFIKGTLEADVKKADYAIVLGDFNNSYVPKNALGAGRNIVNNVAPPLFRKGKQGADYTDGFFVADSLNEKVERPKVFNCISPETGKIYDKDIIDTSHLSPYVKNELEHQRPVIGLDLPTPNLTNQDFDLLDEIKIPVQRTANALAQQEMILHLQAKTKLGETFLKTINELKDMPNGPKYDGSKNTLTFKPEQNSMLVNAIKDIRLLQAFEAIYAELNRQTKGSGGFLTSIKNLKSNFYVNLKDLNASEKIIEINKHIKAKPGKRAELAWQLAKDFRDTWNDKQHNQNLKKQIADYVEKSTGKQPKEVTLTTSYKL